MMRNEAASVKKGKCPVSGTSTELNGETVGDLHGLWSLSLSICKVKELIH